MLKARGVKHGFKESREADGPNFNYYSHVVKLYTVRMSFFRARRKTRRVGILDEKTTFLQSDKFPHWIIKYLAMWHVIEHKWELFKQNGPLYGENSAPKRWENTYAPFLEGEGFERGCNEKSAFYNEALDALILTFVDDNFIDAEEDDIEWTSQRITDRFECKDLDIVPLTGEPVDFLGMLMSMTPERTYLSMEDYINNSLVILEWSHLKGTKVPIVKAIDGSSKPLSPSEATKFHTAQGMLGWISSTARPDVAFAHSRIGQHQSSPTESAMSAVQYAFRYLKGTAKLCLSGKNESKDKDLREAVLTASNTSDQSDWEFFCDSDYAGNSEVQNKRRSQNEILAMLNGVPVYWASKVSSVAFASADIGEAHADTSSAAAEIYGAGNATKDLLHLSYVAEEIGIPFPKPVKLQMDNEAAISFANESSFKSQLKHIDARQEWVRILRDKEICIPTSVDTKDNLADIFTKILDEKTFVSLCDRLMHDPSK